MNEDRKRFIELLAESGAVQFGDFTAKSGRKTPYFINTGKLMYGDQIDLLGKMYAQTYTENIGKEGRLLFGPAYKGITLVAVTAAALYSQYGVRVPVCFNRKEKKDHGESLELLKLLDRGRVESIIIAVDRMEKGRGEQSALAELEQEFGVKVYPIVTIREVVSYLHNREIGGRVYIDDALYARVLEYQKIYGVNSGD